jgi:hypothetical protein
MDSMPRVHGRPPFDTTHTGILTDCLSCPRLFRGWELGGCRPTGGTARTPVFAARPRASWRAVEANDVQHGSPPGTKQTRQASP